MSESLGEFSESSIRKIAKEIVAYRFSVKLHAWIYIFANLLLLFINMMVGPAYPWFLWPSACWAMLFGGHWFSYIIYRKGIPQISLVMLYYHMYFCFSGIGLLVFIARITATPRWTTSTWVKYPIISWLGLLFCHMIIVITFLYYQRRYKQKSWFLFQVEKEFEKIRMKGEEEKKSGRKEG